MTVTGTNSSELGLVLPEGLGLFLRGQKTLQFYQGVSDPEMLQTTANCEKFKPAPNIMEAHIANLKYLTFGHWDGGWLEGERLIFYSTYILLLEFFQFIQLIVYFLKYKLFKIN